MRILLVGGSVRNLLLGRPIADKDFLVLDAGEREFLRRFPKAEKVGKAFPIYWLRGDEFAFPRGSSLDEDLAARDFTVNAMALDADGGLFCHPLALDDLKARILRPAAPGALAEDPLRVFRAARFLSELSDFAPHEDLLAALRDTSARGLLTGLAAERVGRETLKALAGERPSRFVELLAGTSCLRPWFAELEACHGVPAGPAPYHDGDVLAHTTEVLDRLAGDPLRVWMGLCHDLGKALTPAGSWPSHHGHDAAGAIPARNLGQRLALPSRHIQAGEIAARLHMAAARYGEMRPGSRVDLLQAAHARHLTEPLFELVLADHGRDFRAQARVELGAILSVRLPAGDRDQGPESGARLRELRAQVLAQGVAG